MTAQKSKKNDVLRSGYSLIEVLLVVAILSSIAAGAVFGVRNVVQATENTKLQRDVSVLNSAIRTYLLSGGGFGQSDLQNPQAILSKLKRRAGDQNAKELAGLRGTMMDARLSFELQTAAEAVDGVPRARFISDPASPRFIIQTSGPPGIKRFVLDNSLAETDFGTESRNTTLKLAKNDPWVWDYTDAGAGRSTPSAPPRVNPAMSNQSPADITNLMLKTPAFSFSPGTYPLASFPMPLGLTNPNPAGSSQVLFSSNSAPWTAYSGAVNILPTESVTAYAQTLNPELFTDSDSISGAYLAQKVTLRTGDTLPATVNYSALGGPLAAGSVIPGAMLPPRLLLLNGDELPDYWENHSVFQMYWTQDGADPRSSVSRRSGNNTFEVTYPGEEAPLSLGDFASPSLTFKYFAGSKNENAVLSSTVTQKVITRAKLPLLPPQITPDQRSLYGNPLVAMSADLTGGQTPAGFRIFYRTDGTDPGDVNGEPAYGALEYRDAFLPSATSGPVITIVARTYPPVQYKDWFSTSPQTTRSYFLAFGDRNLYAVQKADKNLYALDIATGVSQIIDNSAPFTPFTIAIDGPGALLYYSEFTGNNWRLGRYDIITKTHTILGSLSSGRAYNATLQPDNLVFFNGSLYYIHPSTDDLVKITLSGNSISSVAKVADLLGNASNFGRVGDLALDDNGWIYFNAQDKKYYRFDLKSFSGLAQLGVTEREFDALALYKGNLYGGDDGAVEFRRIALATGATVSKVTTSPQKKFEDFATPSPIVPLSAGTSLWAIIDKANGPHLHEIRNYRSPAMAADIDYGIMYFLDGTSPKAMVDHESSDIQCMCISNAGMLYFVRNFKTHVAGKDYFRPVLRLDISRLVVGDDLNAIFAGDLMTGLSAVAGHIDPDDVVTGLTLSPGGQLYGVLREGLVSGPGSEDYLFRITQTAAALAGPSLPVALVGRLTSNIGASTDTEDLTFAPNGALYASDKASHAIYQVNSNNAFVLSVLSAETDSDYRALAVDPLDYRVIACNYSGTFANSVMSVRTGSANDSKLINLNDLFGLSNVEAVSFFQGPFLLATDPPDLYAADGTSTIYGVDFDTGSTVPAIEAPYQVRALAHDFVNRRLYYLRDDALTMSVGSYSFVTGTHQAQGALTGGKLAYQPAGLPDNLCYFGGFLWYIPPHTDDLVKVELNAAGAIIAQTRAVNLTGDTMQFDLVGDLAVDADGWVYFSAVRYDGQLFCRFHLSVLNSFEVLSGPVAPSAAITGNDRYKEKWLDALAFRTADSTGARPLFGTYALDPVSLRTVSTAKGTATFAKSTVPAVRIIDFSDYHPGNMGVTTSRQRLVLGFANLKSAYTYADVGGAFAPGMLPPPAPVPAPGIVLANANEVPLPLQDSNHFNVKWTYNGQNPKTSAAGVVTGPAFANGMPLMPVAVDFAKWQGRAVLPLNAMAVSLQTQTIDDSALLTADVSIQKTPLRDPSFAESNSSSGQRQLSILANLDAGDCPPATRIYYTTDGSDPGVITDASGAEVAATGTLYTGPVAIPSSVPFGMSYVVHARVYPPAGLGAWFTASPPDYYDVPLGLAGGHMDVDTSHLLYPFRQGTTDGHVHEYDKKYNVVGESFFNFKTTTLKNIQAMVPIGVKFKIIVANANLSTGGRLVINKAYNSSDPNTYVPVATYDDTAPSALTVYSLDGLAGTTRLTELGLYFDSAVIGSGGLLGTVTGAVRSNTPGKLGEWRNGALTIQLVKVNADGSPAFTTNTSLSNGGVQGVATSGLLWETTFFWHHQGGPYGQ